MSTDTHHDAITVHVLREQLPDASQDFPSDAAVLSEGHAMVRAGCKTTGWREPGAVETALSGWSPHNTYVFGHFPPRIQTETPRTQKPLEEWASAALPTEMYTLEDLESFENTNFTYPDAQASVTLDSDPTHITISTGRRRLSEQPESPQRPEKRLKLDSGSLYTVIPLPHYFPSPKHPNSTASSSQTYMRVESIPVFPHTLTSIATVLSAPYARVAWVIPIRGSPPWHGATTSSITFESDVPPRPVDPDDPSDDILWTHASLKAFWAFLQNTATKHWLTLGSLSFSFHAARSFTPVPTDATPSVTPNRYLPPTPSLGSSLPVDQSLRSRLCDIDHIKVYCDANRAMLVRNVFDVWPFEGWQPEGTTDKIKVRVLRLARLALVDGRATGVLIS